MLSTVVLPTPERPKSTVTPGPVWNAVPIRRPNSEAAASTAGVASHSTAPSCAAASNRRAVL